MRVNINIRIAKNAECRMQPEKRRNIKRQREEIRTKKKK